MDNATAIGMSAWDAAYIEGLIVRPEQVAARIAEDPRPRLACSQLGKCAATATA